MNKEDVLGETAENDEYQKLNLKVKRHVTRKCFESLPDNIKDILLCGDNLLEQQIKAIARIPWEQQRVIETVSVQKAKEILEKSHVGLDDIKNKVLRYIACQKRIGSSYGTVLLFCGPPGVGKTSIVSSIADAMNRPMIKISLAGVSDADVLKGTSTIYSNSRPGRIVESIISSKSFSPIILFDEIDKIARGSSSGSGDPQYALIDILDSNRTEFIDECLGFALDLTNVIFIATANDTSKISPILLDRLEVVKLAGYDEEQKLRIIQQCLLPDLYDTYRLDENQIYLDEQVVVYLIRKFSKEPGVRTISNILKQIFEEIVYYIEMDVDYNEKLSIADVNRIFNVESRGQKQKMHYIYSNFDMEGKR